MSTTASNFLSLAEHLRYPWQFVHEAKMQRRNALAALHPSRPTHIHKATGVEYRLVGVGPIEAPNWLEREDENHDTFSRARQKTREGAALRCAENSRRDVDCRASSIRVSRPPTPGDIPMSTELVKALEFHIADCQDGLAKVPRETLTRLLDTLLATEQKLVATREEAARIADMHAASAWTVDGKREAQSIAKAIRASSKAPAGKELER